jgi:hypothetical protein
MRVIFLFVVATAVSGCIYPNAIYPTLPQGQYTLPVEP